ncbi:MAG: hypothetical protein ACK4QW_15620 [Alphaproteobacteria bacterium]
MLIKLSSEEYNALCRLAGEASTRVRPDPKGRIEIVIPDNIADELRELCADELAHAGFDKNEDLTPEGRVLESLIDKFFTG